MLPVDSDMIRLLYKPSQWKVADDAAEHDRRSIYLIAKRNLRPPFLDVFDSPALMTSCGRRESSTHAPQALELLNGRLSNELASSFALPARGRDRRRSVKGRQPGICPRPRPRTDGPRTGPCPGVPPRAALEGVCAGRLQSERVLVRAVITKTGLDSGISTAMYPHSRPTRNRREFVRDAFCGFGGLALASILHDEEARAAKVSGPLAAKAPHLPAKAKSVIFLYMAGGPSHLETFDPKPLLNKLEGQIASQGVWRGQVPVRPAQCPPARHPADNSRSTARAAWRSPTSSRRPPDCADDLAVIRSCHGDMVVHSAAQYELFTGRVTPGFPSMGSWVLTAWAPKVSRCRPTS